MALRLYFLKTAENDQQPPFRKFPARNARKVKKVRTTNKAPIGSATGEYRLIWSIYSEREMSAESMVDSYPGGLSSLRPMLVLRG